VTMAAAPPFWSTLPRPWTKPSRIFRRTVFAPVLQVALSDGVDVGINGQQALALPTWPGRLPSVERTAVEAASSSAS